MLSRTMAVLIATLLITAPVSPAFAQSEAQTPENNDVLAQGKLIFEETAGGFGCAVCHGMDVNDGSIAPPNAGATEGEIRDALGAVVEMQDIKIRPAAMRALAAYIKYLGDQPTVVLAAAEAQTPENNDELAQGKLIFEETAGGVGCAACHGMDGSGDTAPANAGADEATVTSALKNVEDMSSMIKLKHAEIKAVVAYLEYLGDHPGGN